jgi:cell division protein FtsA
LQQLNLDYQEAEQWKQEKGSAIYTLEEEEIADQSEESEVNQQQEFTKEANEIVVARIEEIVENIFAQIRYSGVELSKLRGGIVMAGGGSRLKELEKSVKNKITLPVRKADPSEIVASVPSEATVQLEDALCIGLLLLGKEGNFTPAPSNVAGTKTENKEEKVGELFEVEGVTAQPAENTQKVKKQSHKTGSKLKDLFGSLFNEEDL